jgi:pyrimidine operon attenuation protein/uracil phosphoribosyltransferase
VELYLHTPIRLNKIGRTLHLTSNSHPLGAVDVDHFRADCSNLNTHNRKQNTMSNKTLALFNDVLSTV